MAQHDQIIDNGPGLAVRTDFNAAIAALFSSSSGPTEPSVKVPGQLWYDTSVAGPPVLKLRDQANSTWVTLQSLAAGATFSSDVNLNKTVVATPVLLHGQLNGVDRWTINPGNNAAETGSNAGSDFAIGRYSDAGAFIDSPLTINRKTGFATFIGQLAASGALVPAGATNASFLHVVNISLASSTGGGNIVFNAYHDGTNWRTKVTGRAILMAADPTTTSGLNIYQAASVAAGAVTPWSAKMSIGETVTYSSSAFMASDYAATARIGAYSAAFNTAYIWNVDGSARISLYAAFTDGAGSGSSQLTINRAQGLTSIGPGADMSFYDNTGGSRVLAYTGSNYLYLNNSTGDIALVNAGAQHFVFQATGNFDQTGSVPTKTTAGSWFARSDERIKQNIREYSAGLAEVLKLKPRVFQYRPETHLREVGEDHISIIAQEIETVMPECVSIRDDSEDGFGEYRFKDMRLFDMTPIVYALINSVKQLNARIEALEAKL